MDVLLRAWRIEGLTENVQIIGSFSQAYCFPRAVAYLDGGKVNVKGMVRRRAHAYLRYYLSRYRLTHPTTPPFFCCSAQVTDVFGLEEYQAALDKMNSRGALKIAIKP